MSDSREIIAIPGYEGYFASGDGRLFTGWERRGLGAGNGRGTVCYVGESRRELSQFQMPHLTKKGRILYFYVRIRTGEHKYKSVMAHKLIALAFIGPRPSGLQIRHLDGDHRNNRASNLAYGTFDENMKDRRQHGNDPIGENHPLARLTEEDVREIRRRAAAGESGASLAREFKMHPTAIYRAIRRLAWSHVA